jgi:hypothetical protein
LIAEPPDVIHGQHHLATMTAIARFPGVPVVAICHGWVPWQEMPVKHPAIRRYVAVSPHTRERLVLESGIDPAQVSVLPNFVDVERFPVRTDLPDRPRRALLFSNYAVPGLEWVESVEAACAARNISLEVRGLGYGNPIENPEEYLKSFDLVFAKGRASIEAMATGAAVILCDAAGLGPMVTPDNFEELLAGNFGMKVLRSAHDRVLIESAIAEYDPERVRAVSELVRGSLARDPIVGRLAMLYDEAIKEAKSAPVDERAAANAIADYLYQLNKLNPVPRDEIERFYSARLTAAYRALDRARHDQRELAAMAATAAALEGKADALAGKAAALEAVLEAHRTLDQLRDDQQRVSGTAGDVSAAETELETMRNSTSWRMTAPLRRLGSSARNLAHRARN